MASFPTLRVSNLPVGFERTHLRGLFSLADQPLILSALLAVDTDEVTQTGTVTFRGEPSILQRLKTGDVVVEYRDGGQHIRAKIDVDFHGLTPLNMIDNEGAIVLVAVTGLAGRAFGSWQAGNGMMWLRDYLPRDVGDLRVFTYGYPSKLFGSRSTARLLDFTMGFLECIKAFMKNRRTSRLILIGHSLGCLVIKQALCECELHEFPALRKAVLATVFFGPPHRGLNNPRLQECVLGSPPEGLVQDLRKGSSVLIDLNESFARVCEDFKLITCYELNLTPTIRVDENGNWKRDGPPDMMVDRDSACLYVPNEERIPMQADHSAIAKMNDDPGSSYHSIKNAIANVVDEIFGTRSMVSILYQHCLEVYETLIAAVQKGGHLRVAYQLRVEVAKFELWARLSELTTVRRPIHDQKRHQVSLEEAGQRMIRLLDNLMDQNKLSHQSEERNFSFSHSDTATGPQLSSKSINASFPPSRAILHQLASRIQQLRDIPLVMREKQDALGLLDILHRTHNSIISTLPSADYRTFDQLLLAALLRSETYIDISYLEKGDESIPSDVARSATLKLLGIEKRAGIQHKLKSSPLLKISSSTLDLNVIPKNTSRFVTWQAAAGSRPTRRVLIEWRYYDKNSEPAKNGDIIIRIGELMKILTFTPRPTSLCILDYQGFFHDYNRSRFGFVCCLPEDAPMDSNQPYRTLESVLRDEGYKPSLTDRFELAKALLKCVHQFHLLGWLHKGINCRNILFFDSQSNGGISIRQPYVTGFDLSREDSPVEISERNLDDNLDMYRYKAYRKNTVKFSAAYDIYALGLVLVEIGFWRPLPQLAKSEDADKIDDFVPRAVKQVRHRAGDRFFEVIDKCVRAPSSGNDFMIILEEALIELDRCSI